MSGKRIVLGLVFVALSLPPAWAGVENVALERLPDAGVSITWTSKDPVDLYEAKDRTFAIATARPVATGLTSGKFSDAAITKARRYFILVDERDHQVTDVADRVVPLEQGSNFRDIGGYRTADGRHVRWGYIYRSAGQPLLAAADLTEIKSLDLAQLIDLRSDEERVLAPTKVDGVPVTAVGYSIRSLLGSGVPHNGFDLYRTFPKFLAPELKVVFSGLLHRQTPLAYNCSAGQDRTGFATAMVLSALGVPRETIFSDYLLSTKFRRPEFEFPEINPSEHPNDPAAKMFSALRSRPNWKTPDRLIDENGRPFLAGAFAEIEEKWGSVDAYLQAEVGVSPEDIRTLRALYLE